MIWAEFILFLLLVRFELAVSTGYISSERSLANHSLLFISGWPQSGTSFLHQILDSSSLVSSFISKCHEILGKRCVNWNHEGQWLLSGSTRNAFRSGQMVPMEETAWSNHTAASLRQEWLTFWDVSKPVLVEKSPHSLLKLPALHQAFSEAGSVRFIIILKHPVTLNIATPRNATWKYYRDIDHPKQESDLRTKIDTHQRIINFNHFLQLLTENSSNSLGWIPAMEKLEEMLKREKWSRGKVTLVRYEDFAAPYPLCERLFRFAFSSLISLNHLGEKEVEKERKRVCTHHFSPTSSVYPAVMSTDPLLSRRPGNRPGYNSQTMISHSSRRPVTTRRSNVKLDSPRPRKLLIGENEGNDSLVFLSRDHHSAGRRSLRLRTAPTDNGAMPKLSFRPDLVVESGRQRMKEFWEMTKLLPRSLQDELEKVDKRLRRFGYSLYEVYWPSSISKQKTAGALSDLVNDNALSSWELS